MKTHVSAEPRCALVWNFAPGTPGYGALELAARRFRLRLRAVGPQDLGARVADLCAGRPGQAAPLGANAPALPALIVSGLDHTDGSLGQFLDAVQRGGAGIPLRAMVTPVSRTWTLAELLNELNAEHKAVRGQA